MTTIQSNNKKNRSSKYQPKYIKSHILHVNNSSNSNKNRSSLYQTKIYSNYNNNKTLTHSLHVDNSKQQQQKQIK